MLYLCCYFSSRLSYLQTVGGQKFVSPKVMPIEQCWSHKLYPNKHKTFVQHLYKVVPMSKTLGRRTNVIQMFCVCWDCSILKSLYFIPFNSQKITMLSIRHEKNVGTLYIIQQIISNWTVICERIVRGEHMFVHSVCIRYILYMCMVYTHAGNEHFEY